MKLKKPSILDFVDFRFFKNLKRENPAFVRPVLYSGT